MILYVNGDSHSAGAETVNNYCFADDDKRYSHFGRKAHPDCVKLSYGQLLANKMGAEFICDAESGSSNDRIIRTTRGYLKTNKPDLIIIGWATWEREEWLCDDVYWQVSAGGVGFDWPNEIKQQYKEWVIHETEFDVINQKLIKVHKQIHDFHMELESSGIPHLFFNTYLDFSHIVHMEKPTFDWGNSYIDPYEQSQTFFYWLKENGFKTVNSQSYHYGADAHVAWADRLFQYLNR